MSKFLWLVGGTALALAVYAILNDQNQLAGDGVDRAAADVGGWGLKQRVTGTGGGVLGNVKEFTGKVTGDEQLRGEGVFDQATGAVKDAAGKAAEALGSTIHDLNKS